jgi:hypothetical protein
VPDPRLKASSFIFSGAMKINEDAFNLGSGRAGAEKKSTKMPSIPCLQIEGPMISEDSLRKFIFPYDLSDESV